VIGVFNDDSLEQQIPSSLLLGVLTGAFFVLGFLFLIIIATTARRIERFDEYTAELRRKWGEDVV
jgi:hypothetical protein